MEGGGGPPNAAIIGISASRYQWYAPRRLFRRRRPVIGIPDMQQRVGSHRLPAAGIAGDGGRGHSRKALFNQVIIRQKDIFRPASRAGQSSLPSSGQSRAGSAVDAARCQYPPAPSGAARR